MSHKVNCVARHFVLMAIILAAASDSLMAQQAVPTGWADFTKMFDTTMERDRVNGAAIVVLRDGNLISRHEYGFADRANNKRVTDRTIFHYGSITKTLTAVAVMQLRDRGRLSLDDQVTRYIPELRMVHDPYHAIDKITIRMLLSHSAGFQNPTWPYKEGKDWEPFEPTTWNQLVAMMPYQELLFEPGSRFSYSNPAFIYLARIIEQLTGDSWEVYVQKNIFAPLGMTHSYFGVTPYYLEPDRSHNYTLMKDANGKETV
ncbi:MAG TPA: serine hydrolase domain-containing protein, partial [Candidatus Angelobacter sp.]|nr:serine hydrolase domain-containing protein [Candidatus Angelobacter sp.]